MKNSKFSNTRNTSINEENLRNYVNENMEDSKQLTIQKIAEYLSTSESTVSRKIKEMGYTSFTDFKLKESSMTYKTNVVKDLYNVEGIINGEVFKDFIIKMRSSNKIYVYDKYNVYSDMYAHILNELGFDAYSINHINESHLEPNNCLLALSDIEVDFEYFGLKDENSIDLICENVSEDVSTLVVKLLNGLLEI